MRDITQDPRWCSIDPISAVLGGIIPAMFGGGGKNTAPAPTPEAPPPMAPPPSSPQGTKKSNAPQQQSFIGATPTAPVSSGQKTLLGQ